MKATTILSFPPANQVIPKNPRVSSWSKCARTAERSSSNRHAFNDGTQPHEFALATAAENRKHADEMKKFPDMEHNEPNAKRVAASNSVEIVWKFSKRGEFQFACLIPGHYDAKMIGTVIVK